MEKRQGTPSCLICGASLTSARRTLHPPIPANQEARSFFLQFVVGASAPQVFQANIAESPTEYACKPCFGKLERASKHHRATCSLIGELRTSARASGRISVAGNEPDYATVATPATQVTRKRPQESGDERSTPKRHRTENLQQELGENEGVASQSMEHEESAVPLPTEPLATPPGQTARQARSTPTSVLKVTHVRDGKAVTSYTVRASPFKRIGKTLRYKQPAYTARVCLTLPAVQSEALRQIIAAVKQECVQLCQLKPRSSILRVKSAEELKSFSWKEVIQELKETAPTFLAILQAAAQSFRPRASSLAIRRKKGRPSKHPQKARDSVIGMAAAVLLKERNQQMCKPQAIVSTILYAGHASKKVYGRLNKLGASTTHMTAMRTMHSLGNNHDASVLSWKEAASPEPDYILVGDNVDKNVSPRDMRVDNQVKSLHYFHSYAVRDRIGLDHLSCDGDHVGDIRTLPASAVLPTVGDCVGVRKNYIILAARVIVNNLPHFTFLQPCVVQHIPHQFSKEMAVKSDIIPLGVIPKNENKNEEMVEILEMLQKYVPTNEAEKQVHTVAFGGDQLTVERCRGVQNARVNSDNQVDALEGLHPFASDWHAEVILLQVFFERLYHGGSSVDGGCLLQLRNLLNRRNVAKDVTGRFNATIDFFELIVHCHIIAAALHFFGMSGTDETPSFNALPSNLSKWPVKEQWKVFSHAIGRLIDRYVIVKKFADLHPEPHIPRQLLSSLEDALRSNPHAFRISMEHGYARSSVDRQELVARKRAMPGWLDRLSDRPQASQEVMQEAPDGVFNYASAVLTDGLLLLEFRDAIHEGDGPRIMRCWKFMLLYFFSSGHNKYALEAFNLLADVHSAASPRLAHQIMWSRTVNTQGRPGHNVPVDLHMEHLNRCLKDSIIGLGANVTENTVVQSSKSLRGVLDVCTNIDQACGVTSESMHHTIKGSQTDRDMVIVELTRKSHVFDYIPGRQHYSANFHTCLNIAETVKASSLFEWIRTQQSKKAKNVQLRDILRR